ncbi:P-loop containing nucleoside triphosphate hydrolase [Vibrio phage 1.170.O._10N.261.52.C3]|nr:P-loop containing nucleoside triphosphate hydrolase [Vibrio phage 1.170.O._10N.261.52.C3]
MNEKLNNILSEMGITLTDDQHKVISTVDDKQHTMVIGRPGVGKSLLIDVLKRYYGDRLVVGSTTGISNQRLFNGHGGSGSMHRVFDLPIGLHNNSHRKKVSSFCSNLLSKNHNLEYILIDEAGFLLNSDYLELMRSRIQRFNRKHRDRPKRDIKLILFGDLLQLPVFFDQTSEKYMRDQYGSPYFFKSDVFSEMNFKTVSINEVKRTDDKTFKAALDAMRYGQEDRYPKLCQWLNSIMYKPEIPDGLPLITCWNKEADKVNQQMLESNPNKLWTYHARVTGKYDIKNNPVGAEVSVKVGALVMTLVNDNDNGSYNNGSMGEVTMCVDDGVYVKMFHTQEEVFIGFHTFDQHESVEKGTEVGDDGKTRPKMVNDLVGTCEIIPARLCYATSIHKAQGDNILTDCVVDLGKWGFNKSNSFGESLSYVALSRFSNPRNVYLKYPITPKHIKVNQEILEWVLENMNE